MSDQVVKPCDLSDVRLAAGRIMERQDRNGEYLLALAPDRLLHNFRVNAKMESSATALGGWESPTCGLRGHFLGHYLAACAQMFAATGDQRFKHRIEAILPELQECQRALGRGYLSAFPESDFDTLETKFGGVWAPYYTIHKILAGLIDVHRWTGDDRALSMASGLGDWIARRLKRLPPSTVESMLRTDQFNPSNEYGGVGEALYDLHRLTQRNEHLLAAQTFDRGWFLNPLIEGRDELAGLHANTHIPQALAAAARYEVTGEQNFRRAAEYFWDRTALLRSYINAGSSGPRPDRKERSEGGEHWPEASRLAGTLTPKINESCVVHNMVRLTDVLFRWSRNSRYGDFRERAFFNSVLTMQHPGYVGGYIYSHPLAAGSRKVFGDFDNTFWCCYGTSVEAFARLADGIYFHDEQTVWVNQFVASDVDWTDRQVRISQRTNYPYDLSTQLTVHTEGNPEFSLVIRIPGWAERSAVHLNGKEIKDADVRDGYSTIRRRWAEGDVVELRLGAKVRTEALPGDPGTIAFLYGPTVLAARTAHATELGVTADNAAEGVRPTDLAKLKFQIRLVSGTEVPLVPLNEIVDEAYGVYFKTTTREND